MPIHYEQESLPAVATVPCAAAWQADLLHVGVHLCPESMAVLRKVTSRAAYCYHNFAVIMSAVLCQRSCLLLFLVKAWTAQDTQDCAEGFWGYSGHGQHHAGATQLQMQ